MKTYKVLLEGVGQAVTIQATQYKFRNVGSRTRPLFVYKFFQRATLVAVFRARCVLGIADTAALP
jgi:hypothetical protein